MTRRAGRPARGEAAVAPAAMLDAALALLDARGGGALTMRALGAALGVNPMTVYHHFGNRDGLVAAVADRVYADVAAPSSPDARARLSGLLRAYRAKVLRHPALTLELFQSQSAFPAQARRVSDEIVALLREIGLEPRRAWVWRDLLVDYLHGAALAEAAGGARDGSAGVPVPIEAGIDPLTELLEALLSGGSHGPGQADRARPRDGARRRPRTP